MFVRAGRVVTIEGFSFGGDEEEDENFWDEGFEVRTVVVVRTR